MEASSRPITFCRERYSAQRDVREFARSLTADMRAGRACAVVDVAYVNGADLALETALLNTVDLAHLVGYGGWNTAGNTLGSVLAHAVIRTLQVRGGATAAQLNAHVAFLFTRFVDDYLYQALVRPQVAFEVLPTRDHAHHGRFGGPPRRRANRGRQASGGTGRGVGRERVRRPPHPRAGRPRAHRRNPHRQRLPAVAAALRGGLRRCRPVADRRRRLAMKDMP
ncbi:MAG: DUF4127 family protein [Caldilineaceae bacterium]